MQHLVESGDLPAAVPANAKLAQLLDTTPHPLGKATVTADIRVRGFVTKHLRVFEPNPAVQIARAHEQARGATEQCVHTRRGGISDGRHHTTLCSWLVSALSPWSDTHIPHVVPNSEKPIPLSDIVSSLSPSSLSAHMTSLRRDITAHYIDYTLDYPTSLSISDEPGLLNSFIHRLQRLPSSTNHGSMRLDNLSRILEFMNDKLFPCLPQPQRETFPKSLAKPLTTSIMTRLLIPSLPSKLDALPAFLELTKASVDFETKCIVGMLKGDAVEREIRSWVDNVCAHYERGRRQRILDDVRGTILASVSRPKDTFSAVIVTVVNIKQPSVESVPAAPVAANDDRIAKTDSSGSSIDAEGAWGFDDDVEQPEEVPVSKPDPPEEPEPDPSEAWGWNDELAEEQSKPSLQDSTENTSSEPSEQDEIWDDDPWADANEVLDHLSVAPSNPQLAPVASASSSRQQPLSNGHPPTNDHITNGHPPSQSSQNANIVNKEPYSVSLLVRRIVRAVEDALHEGKALASSGIFSKSSVSTPGTLITQSGALVLDLYRALHPVVAASRLSQPAGRMQFSNDCFHLSEEVDRILKHEQGLSSIQEKLEECKDDLKVLANSWFYRGIVSGRHLVKSACINSLLTSGRTNGGPGRRFSGRGWLRRYVGPGTL